MKKNIALASLVALGLASLYLLQPSTGAGEGAPTPALDTSAVSWTSDRNSPQLRGQVDAIHPSFHKLWELSFPAGVYSSGIIQGGNLYLVDETGLLRCLQLSDGQQRWAHQLPHGVFSPLSWYEGVLYFGDCYGFVRAFDVESKKELWSYQANEEKIAGGINISRDGTMLLLGSYDCHFRVLDRQSGQEKWSLKTGNYINGTPAVWGDWALFGGCDSYMRLVDFVQGEQRSKLKLGSYIPASIACDEELAYACTYDGEVKAIDKAGTIRWTYGGKDAVYKTSACVNSRYVVATEHNGVINVLDKHTGQLQGKATVAGDIEIPALIDEHSALIADKDGTLSIYSLESEPRLLATLKYVSEIVAPLILNHNILIVCDVNGTVSCFQLQHAPSNK